MSPATPALDPEICERARLARDARFDGRFFVAVKTTRIYCRPICPVRLPRPENVTFYPTAAAAAENGYRPCLRCRPELAPDHPWWPLHPPLVREALRRIGNGALDADKVPALAAQLGITDRHLRRLFLQHVGASPQAVARVRRLLFAKQLVTDTALPMQQIAGAAGFRSVRRFNAAFLKVYDRNPRSLRQNADRPSAAFELRLGYRPPFAWDQVQAFLRQRAIAGVETLDGGVYRRSFLFNGRAGVLDIEHQAQDHCVLLEVQHPDPAALYHVAERCRRMLDLNATPDDIAAQLGQTPRIAEALERHPGLRLPVAWDRFEGCVRAVLGQQISVAAATTLLGRLVARCGQSAAELPPDWRLFPEPATLLAANLDGIGLTGRRIATLRRLAETVLSGELALDSGDPADIDQTLASIPGIGPWTRAYIQLRALGQPDALPAGDIVLRKVLGTADNPASAAQIEALAEAWRPWRGYATIALWQAASMRK